MALSKADSKKIQQLAQEGKQTKRIFEDYFPNLSYKEVAGEVKIWGEKSALGRMRMITARLDEIAVTDARTARRQMVHEVQRLVKELYNNHKSSHVKLANIRKALDA